MSATFQFRIANYQAIMAKHNFMNYNRFTAFLEHLPQEHRQQFQSTIYEGQLFGQTCSSSILRYFRHCCQVHLHGRGYSEGTMVPTLMPPCARHRAYIEVHGRTTLSSFSTHMSHKEWSKVEGKEGREWSMHRDIQLEEPQLLHKVSNLSFFFE